MATKTRSVKKSNKPKKGESKHSRLDHAKKAVAKLTPKELKQLLHWLNIEADDDWDRQMKEDAAAGKFDKLLKEIEEESKAGTLIEWP